MSSSSTRLPTPEGSGPVSEAPHVPEGFTDTSGLTRGELLHRGLAASLALGAAGVLADGALGATRAPKARPAGLAIQPFRIKVPKPQLADLRRRIAETRWPSRELVDDRSQRVQLTTTQALARFWATKHDWRACEARLNALPQFTTEIDGSVAGAAWRSSG